MYIVTRQEICNQEQKILRELNGRDYKDANLPDDLQNDLKWYHGLVMQYNAAAVTSKFTAPYYNIFPEKPVSRTKFVTDFEIERASNLSSLSFFNRRNYSQAEKEQIYANQRINIMTAEVMDNLPPHLATPY